MTGHLSSTIIGILACTMASTIGIVIDDKDYYFTGEVLQARTLQGKYIVAGLLTQIQVIEIGKVSPQEIDLPRHTISGERLTLRSLEVDDASGLIVAGLTKTTIASYKINDQGHIQLVSSIDIQPGSSDVVAWISTIATDSKMFATVGSSIFSFYPLNLFSMKLLTQVRTALYENQIAQAVASSQGNLILAILKDRREAHLVDYTTGNILKRFQVSWYSTSTQDSLVFVDSHFPILRSNIDIVSLLMSDGTMVSYDYKRDLYFDKVNFNQSSQAVNIAQVSDSDWAIVSFKSSIVAANIYDPTDQSTVAFQRITSVFKNSGTSSFVVGPNGRIATLVLNGICTSGCLECLDFSIGQKICKQCKDGLELSSDSLRCVASCKDSGHNLYSITGCVATCPKSTFAFTDVCETCDISCDSCYGPYSNRCQSCKDAKKLTKEGKCESSCPQTQYYNTTELACDWCLDNCIECDQSTTCQKCTSGYELDSVRHICIPICGKSSFLEPYPHNHCQKCSEGCTSCMGPYENNCSACSPGYYFANSTCSSICPPGTFKDDQDNICRACSGNCRQCTDSEHCIKCKTGYYRLSLNDSCVTTCDTEKGLYIQDEQSCHTCKHPCKICNQQACLSCRSGYELKMGECWKESQWKNYAFIVIGVLVSIVLAIGVMIACTWNLWKIGGHRPVPRRHEYEMTDNQAEEQSRITDVTVKP